MSRRVAALVAVVLLIAIAIVMKRTVFRPRPVPQITGVSPSCIPSDKKSRLTFFGRDFENGARLELTNGASFSTTLTGSGSLVAEVGPHPTGDLMFSVVNPSKKRSASTKVKSIPGDSLDPNGDCVLSVADAMYLTNHLVGGGPGPIFSGDANRDGKLDQSDRELIMTKVFAEATTPAKLP